MVSEALAFARRMGYDDDEVDIVMRRKLRQAIAMAMLEVKINDEEGDDNA